MQNKILQRLAALLQHVGSLAIKQADSMRLAARRLTIATG